MRRRQAGTSMRASASNSTSPSSAMRPRSGRISPAIMLMMLVLPAPEGPNSAVAPPAPSKRGVQREFAELFFDFDRSAWPQAPCSRAVARRASHSDATSAASEMMTATTTSCSAAASPPGTCVSV